jgi:hypothetical protein
MLSTSRSRHQHELEAFICYVETDAHVSRLGGEGEGAVRKHLDNTSIFLNIAVSVSKSGPQNNLSKAWTEFYYISLIKYFLIFSF